jgi:hypothetical protein
MPLRVRRFVSYGCCRVDSGLYGELVTCLEGPYWDVCVSQKPKQSDSIGPPFTVAPEKKVI